MWQSTLCLCSSGCSERPHLSLQRLFGRSQCGSQSTLSRVMLCHVPLLMYLNSQCIRALWEGSRENPRLGSQRLRYWRRKGNLLEVAGQLLRSCKSSGLDSLCLMPRVPTAGLLICRNSICTGCSTPFGSSRNIYLTSRFTVWPGMPLVCQSQIHLLAQSIAQI